MGSLSSTLAGAPWGIVLVVALAGLLIVLAQTAIQGLIPQNSPDRLAWWQNYWSHRKAHTQDPAPPQHRPPA
ncbi:hypothetical protein [Streptomyces sp. NPDC059378]|uniref:hypothetical protein n=1 Tax=Streptomyces sp. NPDC059378 TaxID=3346815 RepID=UPI0036C53305